MPGWSSAAWSCGSETPHGTLPGTIADVWAEEQAALMPTAAGLRRLRRAEQAGLADLPDQLRAQPLQRAGVLRQPAGQPAGLPGSARGRGRGADRLRARAGDPALPSTCRRRTIYDWRHYLAVIQRKPGALRNGAPFAELPEAFRHAAAASAASSPGGDREMVEILALVLQHDEAGRAGVPWKWRWRPGVPTKTHVLNLLHRLIDGKTRHAPTIDTPQALTLHRRAEGQCRTLRRPARPDRGRCAMRHDPASAAIVIMLRSLKMHGMAQAVARTDRTGRAGLRGGRADPVAAAEGRDRPNAKSAPSPISSRPPASRPTRTWPASTSPASEINEALVRQLHRCEFIDGAHNVVLVGGPGTGKTHVATALGVQAIEHHRKRVRFFSTVELVNALEQEKAKGKAGQIAERLAHVRSRDPGRAGLPAVQRLRRGTALPPAEQALRAHQRRHHHQPQLQRMGQRSSATPR